MSKLSILSIFALIVGGTYTLIFAQSILNRNINHSMISTPTPMTPFTADTFTQFYNELMLKKV